MKQMANDASRATAAKEAAKAKLKARVGAMMQTGMGGVPTLNVTPTKQVVAPASAPAKAAPTKAKTKVKTKKKKPGFWDPNTND